MKKQPAGNPVEDIFAKESAEPQSDLDVIRECIDVLERGIRDDVFILGQIHWNKNKKIERPLYGCAVRALEHAKGRLKS